MPERLPRHLFGLTQFYTLLVLVILKGSTRRPDGIYPATSNILLCNVGSLTASGFRRLPSSAHSWPGLTPGPPSCPACLGDAGSGP